MQEDVVHACPALLEAAQRKAAGGAELKQTARIATGFEPDLPITPAILASVDLVCFDDALERCRGLARGECQLDGQGGARLVLGALELLAAMREEQQAVA